MILNLIPFETVGIFKLNSSIDDYESFNFRFEKGQDITEVDSYSLDEHELDLFVNQSTRLLEWISCYDECIYKGRNLIGISIDEFISHTDEIYYGEIDELDFEDDNIPQHVYEFEDIGLQVWDKNGEVKTIIANCFIDED